MLLSWFRVYQLDVHSILRKCYTYRWVMSHCNYEYPKTSIHKYLLDLSTTMYHYDPKPQSFAHQLSFLWEEPLQPGWGSGLQRSFFFLYWWGHGHRKPPHTPPETTPAPGVYVTMSEHPLAFCFHYIISPYCLTYLHAKLIISQVAGGQQEDGREGRDRAEQAEEGCSQGRTYCFPPLSDVGDVEDTGSSALGFNKNLQGIYHWKTWKITALL